MYPRKGQLANFTLCCKIEDAPCLLEKENRTRRDSIRKCAYGPKRRIPGEEHTRGRSLGRTDGRLHATDTKSWDEVGDEAGKYSHSQYIRIMPRCYFGPYKVL
jgi:hypothetical protein